MSSEHPGVTESQLCEQPEDVVRLPDDLMEAVRELSEKFGEPTRFVIMTAVDHFMRIPDQQKKAVLKGTSIRRRGY
jgi:hypothetical protein